MFHYLPPVGNPVRLTDNRQPESFLQSVFLPYTPRYFASGTAALAAAICAASRLKGINDPEVILPAYGCPDLVSAAVYAGAKPILVDLEADRPWMDLEQLSQQLTPRTTAIVAVDLFGIPERMDRLRDIAKSSEVMLIEDSAQFFPGGQERPNWGGDLVVLSFGRGKPVSMLGGGALLVRDAEIDALVPGSARPLRADVGQRVSFRLKAMIYNLLTNPWLYWIPRQFPFLHLGETLYHPLSSIAAIDAARFSVLAANVKAYRDAAIAGQKAVAEMLAGHQFIPEELVDLASVCQAPVNRRLLRYPLLVNRSVREKLYANLERKGLGPSRMYPVALPAIPGLESILSGPGPFPAADAFAACVLTLPVHGRVRGADIGAMRQVFEKTFMDTVL
jgi:dTDP-4-amino-4,6-dideoxygalactose transaminase